MSQVTANPIIIVIIVIPKRIMIGVQPNFSGILSNNNKIIYPNNMIIGTSII